MSVEQIKDTLASLTPAERDHITAFLMHLRNASDPEYQAEMAAKLADKDPANWLTLEEFERRLDQD